MYFAFIIFETSFFSTNFEFSCLVLPVALPTEGPKIYGSRPIMKAGEVASVNCTSSKSKPVAVLKWFINDNVVDDDSKVRCFHSHYPVMTRVTARNYFSELTTRDLNADSVLSILQLGGDYETIASSQADNDGLEISSLALKFVVSNRHFNYGILRLKCTATIDRVYALRNEVLIISEEQRELQERSSQVMEVSSQGKQQHKNHVNGDNMF
jgi:hypothetical protein